MKQELKMNQAIVRDMLPDMPQDFAREMTQYVRALPYRTQKAPARRKLSVGLVFVLVLMLLCVGAVAAVLLRGKAFVNDVMAPLASNTENSYFTEAEIDYILSVAAQNDITLPDSLLEELSKWDDGYDKEELMRAFAKTELGFYPGSWSIEDQAWYGQLLIACKVIDYTASVLPGDGELTQDQALQIVYAELEKLGADLNALQDAALYRRSMTYQEVFESEYRKGRMWSVSYDALDPYHDSYSMQLWSDGRIDSAIISQKGFYEENALVNAMPSEVQRFYTEVFGDMEAWSEETWLHFQDDLRAAAQPYGVTAVNESFRAILRQTYAVPNENEVMPRETALTLAREKTGAQDAVAVYLLNGDTAYWKVTVTQDTGVRYMRKCVEINAMTGEMSEVMQITSDDPWCRPYVLEKNLPIEIHTELIAQPLPTARPDGHRAFWESDVLPSAVWDQLNALNYNTETGMDLFNQWCRVYGEDTTFWPHDKWALEYLAHEIVSSEPTALPGIPLGDEMPEDEIIQKAWSLTSELGNFSQRDPDTLRPVARIWYGLAGEGSVTWVVTFIDITEENYGERVLKFRFDAFTGDIVHETRPEIDTPSRMQVSAADGDFPQEEAEKLARDLLYDMCSHRLTRAQSDALWVEWKLIEDWYQEGDRIYYFEFGDESCSPGNGQAIVIIDAYTGMIVDGWYEPVGNG